MLSGYGASLLRELAGAPDPMLRADPAQLTAEDLGTLLPAAYRTPHGHPARNLATTITGAVQHRQPSFTPESFTALLAALVEIAGRNDGYGGDPVLAVAALLRCDGPPPAEASRLARKLAGSTRSFFLYAESALASLGGARLPRPTAEVAAVAAAGPVALALLAEVAESRSYYSPPPLPDAWERLAGLPGYPAFLRAALESARDRIAAIHAGRKPFQADAAFTKDEVATLGRAVRIALLRDEPWLLTVLRPLVLGVAIAPTAARTLPSQALLFEVARATEDQPTPELLTLLRGARELTRHQGVRQQLDRKFPKILRALGDRPEVALYVPDLGFDRDGIRVIPVGAPEAVVAPQAVIPPEAVVAHEAVVTLGETVTLGWRLPGGKLSATVPAAVRRDHPEAVKELRDLVKQVRGHLTTLARSLEAGLATGHEMPYHQWRSELAANGLAWSVLQRLIWEIPDGEGGRRAVLPVVGGFTGPDGTVVPEPAPGDPIRLWHPLGATTAQVGAWRDLLVAREVRQPVKQAFREVYRLTPAEAETGTYSNRFAAHIVHYKQFYALVKGRGWATSMLGPWDGGDTAEATRVLAGGAWRVTLLHDYRDETADGVPCAGTDRVWFDRRAGASWQTVPLTEVPPLILTEALRDVDLFVSVTSVAADPAWFDGHLDRWPGDHLGYWQRAHDAPLTATAEVRRSALARLLPRTRIADRCELTDRHLVVRGDLHTYRIHLGSGNILVEPGSTYLCIVPAAKAPREKLFVPFTDERLTVILSKAFLLAGDTAISDPSIVAQLKRAGG
jgi:hypothetical protein